jgi:hypothetical protein|tara:strand:- start:44 stop:442 length:399 start_codon:yes stop_codon:yes gene_type:complete
MEEIKVAVLDQKLEDLRDIVVRIDSAIEKLSEVNSNVSKMLAVHEERITKQEEIDTILFAKIDKLRDKMDLDHDKISARLSLLERRVWTAVGALAAAAILSNPQATRLLKPLFSSAQSAIIAPVVAVVNESH